MPTRYVIPAGAKPTDQPHAPRRLETWADFAREAGATIANLGDAWCQEYGITGLGLAEPRETVAERAARRIAAQEAAGANRRTVEGRARAALAANATYLALGSPTNAQNLAQIRLLTRECSALIRLMLNELDTTDGT